jgi:hypothetical protein
LLLLRSTGRYLAEEGFATHDSKPGIVLCETSNAIELSELLSLALNDGLQKPLNVVAGRLVDLMNGRTCKWPNKQMILRLLLLRMRCSFRAASTCT